MSTRNIEKKQTILNKIKEYQTIVISRHVRPDGDAIGSSHGLAEILKQTFPSKNIYVSNSDDSDYLAFLNTKNTDSSTIDYSNALAIVVDTGNIERCANPDITKAKELIKIDHHIETSPYGDISWVEDDRSSVCEMITDFLYTFKDQLKYDKRCALLLYTGMVTDSGRFKYAETSGETLRLAAFLFDMGLDTQMLYANLYLEDFDYYKFQSYVFDKMQITKSGVLYLYVDQEMQDKFHLSREQASGSVEFMNGVKGSLIWLAFIDNGDGSTRVRLRSRFMAVNTLAEKYHGGGHANAAGATVHSKEEMQALIDDAEEMLRKFKAENTAWL